MADEKAFITVKVVETGESFDHTGYKSMMRQFAEPEFRIAHEGHTMAVTRSGKPFIRVIIDSSAP